MTKYETGAVRNTGGKGRMDLLPWSALIRVSKHMEDALTHYPERNWEIGLPLHTMIDSAFRHLAKYMEGWDDEDHLCSAATNLLMALWTEEHYPDMNDIPARRHLSCSPLHEENQGILEPACSSSTQEKQKEVPPVICHNYDSAVDRCTLADGFPKCFCHGDTSQCDLLL